MTLEGIDTSSEVANTGQNHTISHSHLGGIGCQVSVGSGSFEPLLRRAEVADPVVEDSYARSIRTHNTPLVDGMLSPSTRTASRRARAVVLNVDSTM